MNYIYKEHCIYCGGDIQYHSSKQLIKCEWCGEIIQTASFENELIRLRKAEEDSAIVRQELAKAEQEKQAADARLFAALSNLDSLEMEQGEVLELVKALRSETAGQTDTLSSLLHTLLSGQKDADSQLQLLAQLSDRILKTQDDILLRAQTQSEVITQLYSMQMDVQERQKLAAEFMLWIQNVRTEDAEKLEQIARSSGSLLAGQKKIGDNVDRLRKESADIQKTLKDFEGKWESARLQEIYQLYHQAADFQSDRRFDKAEEYYRKVLTKGGEDPEVYWRLLMCHYCLTYQKDDEGRQIPIILNPDLTDPEEMSIRRELIQHLQGEKKQHYQKELAKIDRILDKYRLVRNRMQYDIFISVKQKKDGHYTSDSDTASDLYDFLTQQGMRVFNSKRFHFPAGEEYEPYIISALLSAKVLIVVGTTPGNMNAQWVRNEWTRFQWLQRKEKEKTGKTERVLICYLAKGMEADQIPKALHPDRQAIYDGVKAHDELLASLAFLGKSDTPVMEVRTVRAQTPQEDFRKIQNMMTLWLVQGNYDKVKDKYRQLCEEGLFLTKAALHLAALCAENKVYDIMQIVNSSCILEETVEYKSAIMLCDSEEEKQRLRELKKQNRDWRSQREQKTAPVRTVTEPVKKEVKAKEIVDETLSGLTPADSALVMEKPGFSDQDPFVEIYPAMRIRRGAMLRDMLQDWERGELILQNPYVLITNEKLEEVTELYNIARPVIPTGRSLLVIAQSVGELALKVFSGPACPIPCAVIPAPAYGDRRIAVLRDIALFTNGTAIINGDGESTQNLTLDMFGSVTQAIVREDETILINTGRNDAAVDKRVKELKKLHQESVSDYDREKLTEQINDLQGRAAVFWVSGNTDSEKKEKIKQIDRKIKEAMEYI